MKRTLFFYMFACIAFASCEKEHGTSLTIEDETIDLSSDGTANCYVLSAPGAYHFDATVIGNGASGIVSNDFHTISAMIAPQSAKLIWQDYYEDGEGLITEVALNDDKTQIVFTTTEKNVSGNAVIAACDNNGNILWSWHIWKPLIAIEGINSSTGYSVMNINLGAVTNEVANPKSYGMLYQWGRNNPFPASATLTGTTTTVSAPMYNMEGEPVTMQNSDWANVSDNTILNAIQKPTTCFSRWGQLATSGDWLRADNSNDALWGNPKGYETDENFTYINKGVKSIYDPCPAGWRVPPVDVFKNFINSMFTLSFDVTEFQVKDLNNDGVSDINDYNYGWVFKLNDNDNSYFPSASRFDGQYGMLMGSMSGIWGTYWSNSSTGPTANPGTSVSPLSFGTSPIMVSVLANANRADAYSIRCIKEN